MLTRNIGGVGNSKRGSSSNPGGERFSLINSDNRAKDTGMQSDNKVSHLLEQGATALFSAAKQFIMGIPLSAYLEQFPQQQSTIVEKTHIHNSEWECSYQKCTKFGIPYTVNSRSKPKK